VSHVARSRFVRCAIALVVALALSNTRALSDPAPLKMVDVGQLMIVLMPNGAPIASIILIPGGPATHPEVMPDGSIPSPYRTNFLIKERRAFVSAGFAVGIVEKPQDLRGAIAYLRVVKRPVFVVGHSDGTAYATNAAVSLGTDGPDGVVLASSIVATPAAMDKDVLAYPLAQIALPVLLVRNENDGCRYSPPSGMDTIAKQLVKADVSTVTMSSTELSGDPCQGLSPHGYLGIEEATIAKIIDWLNAHASTPK
jgi:predicted esterase